MMLDRLPPVLVIRILLCVDCDERHCGVIHTEKGQLDVQGERQTDKQVHRHIDSQTDRQTDRQTQADT